MKPRGFTLIELLIAMAIFALVSVAAYTGLHQILRIEKHSEAYNQRLTELQKAITLLDRDLFQLVNRPVRDENGGMLPALVVSPESLELTRMAPATAAIQASSYLKRIGYFRKEDKLHRQLWPTLDRAPNTDKYEDVLLDEVEYFLVRVNWQGQWRNQWPRKVSKAAKQQATANQPNAISYSLKVKQFPEIKRTVMIDDTGNS